MKRVFLFAVLFWFTLCTAQQQSVNFNYTGAVQTWVVPQCVTSINVVAAGAKGGGGNGGNGARITGTLNVTPGQTLNIYVGGLGTCGNNGGGWNGGGTGHASNPANATYNSCGGGGASDIRIGGTALANRVIVAGGGGGEGGGSVSGATNFGGPANCNNGAAGGNTFGAGGGGGTQAAGGNGGAPWAGTPPGGQAGSLGQGGNGGLWQTASGGGGGGGYYGGGGGGNDGCCTGANGGGGGGGGSSLLPAGGTCLAGNNAGNGYVTITWTPVVLNYPIIDFDVSCFGLCDGVAYVGNWGVPIPGATYLWNPGGQTTQSIANLCAGNYTVTITVSGCTQTGTVTITQPAQVLLGPISHN